MTTEEMMQACRVCPRECKVNRAAGQVGFCGQSAVLKVARAALHYWEEPCISGTEGSGAIFFSGCVLRCVFCQNHDIAAGHAGKEITVERLAEICLELQEQGANNINLVTPTHYAWQIADALTIAKEKGLKIPVVYNTGGYESVETLRRLEGLVDVYMPDMKYRSEEPAAKYSRAADYFEKAAEAIREMVRQTGAPVFENDLMKRGVLVRHLVLPGHTKDSRAVLGWLHETFGEEIWISVMNQYTPVRKLPEHPEIDRKVTKREYEKVLNFCLEEGIEQAFFQEGGTVSESFIPAFDGTGV